MKKNKLRCSSFDFPCNEYREEIQGFNAHPYAIKWAILYFSGANV